MTAKAICPSIGLRALQRGFERCPPHALGAEGDAWESPADTSGMDSCSEGKRSLREEVVLTVATGKSVVRRGPEEAS
jgi:hypothetical protein